MSKQTQGSMLVVGSIAGVAGAVAFVALLVMGDYGVSAAFFLAVPVAAGAAVALFIGLHRDPDANALRGAGYPTPREAANRAGEAPGPGDIDAPNRAGQAPTPEDRDTPFRSGEGPKPRKVVPDGPEGTVPVADGRVTDATRIAGIIGAGNAPKPTHTRDAAPEGGTVTDDEGDRLSGSGMRDNPVSGGGADRTGRNGGSQGSGSRSGSENGAQAGGHAGETALAERSGSGGHGGAPAQTEARPGADDGAAAHPGAEGASQVDAAPDAYAGPVEKPRTLDAPENGSGDDLKRIKGVGPKLEEMLNGMGIWHFGQIAGWGEPEVAWVDRNIEGFKGRASRDEWVPQAKVLAGGGETAFSSAGESEAT